MGRRGPAPTPTKTLRLRGSWLAKTRDGEPEPKGKAPGCPAWLDREAKAEWRRVVPELDRLGLLARLDRGALVSMCAAWSVMVTAIQEATVLPGSEYRTREGRSILKSMHESIATYHRFCGEFGLTPSARSRVRVPESKRKDAGKDRFFQAKKVGVG